MKKVIYECNQCRREFSETDVWDDRAENIFEVTSMFSDQECHFCSAECLIRYIADTYFIYVEKMLDNLAEDLRKKREKEKLANNDELPF